MHEKKKNDYEMERKAKNRASDSKTEMESSPLRSPIHFQEEETFLSPPESPIKSPEKSPPTKAIVPVSVVSNSHGFSPFCSSKEDQKQATQPENAQRVPVKPPSPMIVFNRSIREELSVVKRVDPGGGDGGGSVEDGCEGRSRAVPAIVWRSRKEGMVKRAALGFRVLAVVFCLISFSVMAADKTQGWSGDSFDRYKEFRYCISVNVIAFVYSGFQAYDVSYHLTTGKHLIFHPIRFHLDFSMDQILTYLLISASSSAATRVEEWQSNWGKDEFTKMASASVGMSFLAFVAFALSSLISGYNLCYRIST